MKIIILTICLFLTGCNNSNHRCENDSVCQALFEDHSYQTFINNDKNKIPFPATITVKTIFDGMMRNDPSLKHLVLKNDVDALEISSDDSINFKKSFISFIYSNRKEIEQIHFTVYPKLNNRDHIDFKNLLFSINDQHDISTKSLDNFLNDINLGESDKYNKAYATKILRKNHLNIIGIKNLESSIIKIIMYRNQ